MVCSSNPAQLLLCILAAACCLAAVNASFERVSVTGTLKAIKNGTLLPVNYWDYNVTGASNNTIYNPKWLNVALNSTTVPIKDSAVKFGFGRIAGPVNITITLDIDARPLAVYKIACAAPKDLACIVTQPFAAALSIRTASLVAGSVDVLFNNVTDDLTTEMNRTSGTYVFTVGPLNGSASAIDGGRMRQMVFKMNEAGQCAVGECCDLKTGTVKPEGTVCRPAASVCDLAEPCNGVTASCPRDKFVEDGMKCLWVLPSDPILGSDMSDTCSTPSTNITASNSARGTKGSSSGTKASSAAAQPLKAPPGGWGKCSGTCQAGICSLNCTKPQCCSPVNPELGFRATPGVRYSSQASHEDVTEHSGCMMPLDAVDSSAGGVGGAGVQLAIAKTAAGVVPVPVPVQMGAGDELAPGVPFPVGAVVVSPMAAGMTAAGVMREELPVVVPQPEELLCWGA